MPHQNAGRITRRQMIRRVMAAAAVAGGAEISSPQARAAATHGTHRLTPVPIRQVRVDDPFWSPKLKVWREVMIDDCFTKFDHDQGGAMTNFDLVRDGQTGKHAGPPWYDGLIYEMIRGCADYLAARRDPALEARLDGYIARIAAAQAKDPAGYINTWTEMMLPQTQRWGLNGGDDRWQHEIYNAGMMIEAGAHYYRATGKTALLAAATRMANLMCDTIGPAPKANAIPGHSGPEEALVKLYRLYRETPPVRKTVGVPVDPIRYLKLAEFFIDARGHYEGRTGKDTSFGAYGQDHAPLARQKTLEGHAVRAALFCTGIVAAADVTGRADYLAAGRRFWDSLIGHKMYISGAAGAIASDEKLGPDYFLPNDGYMETCAAVALGFFSHNMNLLHGEARYVDELERALYNAVPGGVALSGDHYYYENPLQGEGLRRWDWHGCPCCPPMFLKITGALPGYIYAQDAGAAYVNLFVGSRADLTLRGARVRLRQETRYPWQGDVKISVDPAKPAAFDLMMRIPAWCHSPAGSQELYPPVGRPASGAVSITVNGAKAAGITMERGYARIRRQWKPGDVVRLSFDMPVRQVKAHPGIEADRGRVALMRGPVLYCVEGVDNPSGVRSLFVPPSTAFAAEYRPRLLGGVAVVKGKAKARTWEAGGGGVASAEMTAVPFYASANREACAMRVWLPASEEKAVAPTLASLSVASASCCWYLDSAGAINDGVAPVKSSDTGKPRLSWWDHKGTTEWAQLTFPKAARVSRVRVFWFADRSVNGGCDLPKTWRLLYQDGDVWKPVPGASNYETALDCFNEVTFPPVTTTALRIEAELQPGWSGGICEWEVG